MCRDPPPHMVIPPKWATTRGCFPLLKKLAKTVIKFPINSAYVRSWGLIANTFFFRMPARVAATMISVLCVGFETIPRHLLNSLEKFSRNVSSAEAKWRRPLHLSPGPVHVPEPAAWGKAIRKAQGEEALGSRGRKSGDSQSCVAGGWGKGAFLLPPKSAISQKSRSQRSLQARWSFSWERGPRPARPGDAPLRFLGRTRLPQ